MKTRNVIVLAFLALVSGVIAVKRIQHDASQREAVAAQSRAYERIEQRTASSPRFELTYAELTARAFREAAQSNMPRTTFMETPVTRGFARRLPRLDQNAPVVGYPDDRSGVRAMLARGEFRSAKPRIFALIVTQVNDSPQVPVQLTLRRQRLPKGAVEAVPVPVDNGIVAFDTDMVDELQPYTLRWRSSKAQARVIAGICRFYATPQWALRAEPAFGPQELVVKGRPPSRTDLTDPSWLFEIPLARDALPEQG